MASRPPDLTIRSLRGGLNTDDAPSEMKPDQCEAAMNVEFRVSPCGHRRFGAFGIDQGAYANTFDAIPFLARHLPTDDESAAQLWAVGVSGAATTWFYKDTAWHTVSPLDALSSASAAYAIRAVSFHHKLFVAYASGVDRLHVWDGTTLRRCGLATPATPTAAEAGVGTFSGTRYYRVRYTVQNGSGVTLRRSEPSGVLTFIPSGTSLSVNVTKPASISESETHWELEASLDNVNFYRITTAVVASTVIADQIIYSIGYAASFGTVLSETSGDYTVPPSVALLTVDEDRLVMAGNNTTAALNSRVTWTTVNGDPGSGNDERVPIATVNFLDLDAGEGGGITDMSQASGGFFYVFKWSRIYKMVRTGVRSQAYTASVVSKTLGALPGSVVSGVDEFGRSCIYALDPSLGPYRLGANGVQLHHGMGSVSNNESAWYYINRSPIYVNSCSVYYPDAQQVCWWVNSESSDFLAIDSPNMKIVLQVDATRATDTGSGIEGGLSLANGHAASALCACLFADDVDTDGPYSRNLKPFTGTLHGASFAHATIRIHDSEDSDGTDDGVDFAATLTSAPIMSAGFLNRFGVLSANVMGRSNDGVVVLGLSRDFGSEEKSVTVTLPYTGGNEVIGTVDDLGLADCRALQVSLHDPIVNPANGGIRWKVTQIALSQSVQEKG